MLTSHSVYDEFQDRMAQVITHLTGEGLPLTAPPAPAADPDGPWASPPAAVDRTTLAWCTAALMLANHHQTPIHQQAPSADALLRERGIRGLAELHSDLHHGAPVDYDFTRCPYCSGIGDDPTQPTGEEVHCPPQYEFADHDHLCPVCHGAEYAPEYHAQERLAEIDRLLTDTISASLSRRNRFGLPRRR
ncbi:hypothetical protein ACFYM7_37575 [Streptomyces cyaneofuscatus]|uniref:hypothetical protein n=1 Tax=Streptomyces cyaneofuscatus TaxID=66883 RepID=UPI003677CE0F